MQHLGADDVGRVFECLKGALSTQSSLQKNSEAILKSLETQPGFCSCLVEIIKNKQADHGARWLAVVQLKNCVTRFWKPRGSQGGMLEEEKAHLRQAFLEFLDQDNQQIAVQIAVIFAKVARFDYPRHWPSLFQDLTARLASQKTLTIRRVYLVLHHIIKELASMRLPADKKNFQQVTELLYESFWTQWCSDTQALLEGLPDALKSPQQPTQLNTVFERWLLELKGLRRMILFSAQSDAKTLQGVQAVSQVAPACLQALQAFLQMRPLAGSPRSLLHAMLDRGLLKLTKTLTDVLDTHPWSLFHSGSFQGMIDFFCSLLMVQPKEGPAYERFIMQVMISTHGVLTSKAYRGVSESLQAGPAAHEQVAQVKQMAAEAQAQLKPCWQGESGQLLCRSLVRFFFPLTVKELQEWAESPEEFHQQSGLGVWQESLRTCAETLFATLLAANREELAPVVVDMLRKSSEACPSGSTADSLPGPRTQGFPDVVLAKEAAYNAVGVAAWDLHDYLDFTAWLHASLLPDLADTSHAAKPVRRRAAILLGQWVSKLRAGDRPAVYRALLALMADEDLALSLAGCAALQDLVNDWDFVEEPFMEFVGPCLHLLAQMLHGATSFDTQLQVFNLINLIIDRLADSIKPFTGVILHILPQLWQESEGQSLLRIQILLALQRVVNALGVESPTTYPLLLPILQLCTDVNQPDELNLLEDALQLWLVTLRNAPEPNAQLLSFFPNLVAAIDRSTEHVQVATQLIASCLLLGGAPFLSAQAGGLVAILLRLVASMNEKGMLLLLPVLDLLLRSFPAEAPQLLEPVLQTLLLDMLSSRHSTLVIAAALGVFARLLLQSSAVFVSFFSGAAAKAVPSQDPMQAFVDLWLDKFDSIGSAGSRKLSALALCILLQLPTPWLLQRLTPLFAHITSVWYQVEGSQIGGPSFGYDFYNSVRPDDNSGDSGGALPVNSEEAQGEYTRRRLLHEKDPVNQLKLSEVLRQSLDRAAVAHGEAFGRAVAELDPSLASQVRTAIGQS